MKLTMAYGQWMWAVANKPATPTRHLTRLAGHGNQIDGWAAITHIKCSRASHISPARAFQGKWTEHLLLLLPWTSGRGHGWRRRCCFPTRFPRLFGSVRCLPRLVHAAEVRAGVHQGDLLPELRHRQGRRPHGSVLQRGDGHQEHWRGLPLLHHPADALRLARCQKLGPAVR